MNKQNFSNSTVNLYGFVLPLVLGLLLLGGGTLYVKSPEYRNRFEAAVNNSFNEGEEVSKEVRSQSDLKSMTLTEVQINALVSSRVIGQGAGDFTISSGQVKILEDGFLLQASLEDGTKVEATLTLNEDGDDVTISDLTLSNAGSMAGLKESLLRTFLSKGIAAAKAEYGSHLDHIEIDGETVTVFYFD